MELKLHANATTTPKTRAYIQASPASVAELGVSEATVRPQTNGLVERFNRRIAEAIARQPRQPPATAPSTTTPSATPSSKASSTTTIEHD